MLQLQSGNGTVGNNAQVAAMLRAQQPAAVQSGNDNGNAQIIELLTALLSQKVRCISIAWASLLEKQPCKHSHVWPSYDA